MATPELADLAEVLTGRTYPTAVVPVTFDEKLTYEIRLLEKAIPAAEGKVLDELTAKLEELQEKFRTTAHMVHLKGASREDHRNVMTLLDSKFPDKTGTFGQVLANPEKEYELSIATLGLMLEKVEWPDGRITPGNPDSARFLIDNLPDASMIAVNKALYELRDDAADGYDSGVRALGF